jgi:signal transduction histidine kinase
VNLPQEPVRALAQARQFVRQAADRGRRPAVAPNERRHFGVLVNGRKRRAVSQRSVRVFRSRLARRLLTASDVDRQRIERDLHDGVQQRLTALRIRLAIAADAFNERGETAAGVALNRFGVEVEQVIDEVRAFAHGVYPELLASNGLGAALTSVGRRAGGQVSVSTQGLRRCRPEVENAVYFTCLAALDNATRHAGPAWVCVHAWDTPHALRFVVGDTGCGFDLSRQSAGAGLANMRDRIAALGGTLTFDSSPSHGTRVHGSVPDPWLDSAKSRFHTTAPTM